MQFLSRTFLATTFAVLSTTLPATAADHNTTGWVFRESVNAMTDTAITQARIRTVDEAQLLIVCNRSGLFAYVKTGLFDFGHRRTRKVDWRIDKGPVTSGEWHEMEGNSGGVITNGDDALRLARTIMRAEDRVVVDNGEGRAIFGIRNAATVIRKVLAVCGVT